MLVCDTSGDSRNSLGGFLSIHGCCERRPRPAGRILDMIADAIYEALVDGVDPGE